MIARGKPEAGTHELPPELREVQPDAVNKMRSSINWGKIAKRALLVAALVAAIGTGGIALHATGIANIAKIPYLGPLFAKASHWLAPRGWGYWKGILARLGGKSAAEATAIGTDAGKSLGLNMAMRTTFGWKESSVFKGMQAWKEKSAKALSEKLIGLLSGPTLPPAAKP